MKNPNICSKCIGKARFKRLIQKEGFNGKCDIVPDHGQRSKVLTATKLAEKIDLYFKENYCIGTDEIYVTEDSDNPSYCQRGLGYADIMMKDLKCDEEVIQAIEPNLPDVTSYDISQGEEPFYDSSQLYESISAIERREQMREEEYWYENRFSILWEDFCNTVIYRQRFFNVTQTLDTLFGESEEFESGEVNPIHLMPSRTVLFRTRLIGEGLTSATLSKRPALELGPPPIDKARAGRMNVAFIPVFYAAFNEETAIAEVRPSIDDEIAIGKFITRRDLKVFDLTVFSKELGDKLHDVVSHTRYDFISQLESEISKPIRASDKARDYIPTQIVAEHIRERFDCDGIIYKSSMMKGNTVDTSNIILFDKHQPFLGAKSAALEFSQYEIKIVRDIEYKVTRDIF